MKTMLTVDPRLPRVVSTVALEVNEIIQSEEFLGLLESHKEQFAQSNIDGPTLAAEFRRVCTRNLTVQVVPYSYPWYKPLYRRTVVAFVQAPRIRVINLNTYFTKLGRDDRAWAKTIGHEFTHVIDFHSPYHFGHGDNDPSGDAGSATDYVGMMVSAIYDERRTAKLNLALSQGDKAFRDLALAIGTAAPKINELLASIPKPFRRVYDYGTESSASKNTDDSLS